MVKISFIKIGIKHSNLVIPSGKLIVVIFVFENVLSSISFNEDGNIMFVNCEQLQKHPFPILVIPSGIIIVVIFVSSNALSPISFNEDGNIIFVNSEQLSKQF